MRSRFCQKFYAVVTLAVFLGVNFDFLVFVTAGAQRTLPARHDFKCYCSLCYSHDDGCLCGINPHGKQAPDSPTGKSGQAVYKACGCFPQEFHLAFFSSELNKCFLHEISALAPSLPQDNNWPEDRIATLEDSFKPSIFHPPENFFQQQHEHAYLTFSC